MVVLKSTVKGLITVLVISLSILIAILVISLCERVNSSKKMVCLGVRSVYKGGGHSRHLVYKMFFIDSSFNVYESNIINNIAINDTVLVYLTNNFIDSVKK